MHGRRFYLEAQKLAVSSSSSEIVPVHLLYGLCIDQSGLCWKILHELGITEEIVRRQVLDEGENSRSSKLTIEELPPSVESKLALEQSWNSASNMGSSSIETEHILLGLIRLGILSQFLAGADKDATVLEERVKERVGSIKNKS